jgi:hypothetical protein
MEGERVNILGLVAVARSTSPVWRDHRCASSFVAGRRVVHRGSLTSGRGIIVSPQQKNISFASASVTRSLHRLVRGVA